ncbi:MAG: hypothetical protein M3O22_07285 [Pseudomonadota bacterium]|nr:hypothetical protein [Pseudomonadota bacterium]
MSGSSGSRPKLERRDYDAAAAWLERTARDPVPAVMDEVVRKLEFVSHRDAEDVRSGLCLMCWYPGRAGILKEQDAFPPGTLSPGARKLWAGLHNMLVVRYDRLSHYGHECLAPEDVFNAVLVLCFRKDARAFVAACSQAISEDLGGNFCGPVNWDDYTQKESREEPARLAQATEAWNPPGLKAA